MEIDWLRSSGGGGVVDFFVFSDRGGCGGFGRGEVLDVGFLCCCYGLVKVTRETCRSADFVR